MGAATPEPQSNNHALDDEAFKVVADNMVLEAGIMPILHHCFVALVMNGKRIKGIITKSKFGREAILAGRVIDATGVGDVARRSGVPMHKTPKFRYDTGCPEYLQNRCALQHDGSRCATSGPVLRQNRFPFSW